MVLDSLQRGADCQERERVFPEIHDRASPLGPIWRISVYIREMHGNEMSLLTSFIYQAEEICVWQKTFAGSQTCQTQTDVGNEPQRPKAEKHHLRIQMRG